MPVRYASRPSRYAIVIKAICLAVLCVPLSSGLGVSPEKASSLAKAWRCFQEGDLRAATILLDRLVADAERRSSIRQDWRYHRLRWAIYAESGRYTEAVAAGRECLACMGRSGYAPTLTRARQKMAFDLSRTFRQLGDLRAARDHVEMALAAGSGARDLDPIWNLELRAEFAQLIDLQGGQGSATEKWFKIIRDGVWLRRTVEREAKLHPRYLQVIDVLIGAYAATGDKPKALELLGQVARGPVMPQAPLERARWLVRIARGYQQLGALQAEIGCLEECEQLLAGLAQSDAAASEFLCLRADVRWRIAEVYRQALDEFSAERSLRDCIAACRTCMAAVNDVRQRLLCQQRIHAAYDQLEEFEQALRAGEILLSMFKKHVPPKDPRVYRAMTSLGVLHFRVGSRQEASRFLESALTFFASQPRLDAKSFVTSLLTLSQVKSRTESLTAALQLLRDRAPTCEKALQGEEFLLASIHAYRGRCESAHGYYLQAVDCLRKAEVLLRRHSAKGEQQRKASQSLLSDVLLDLTMIQRSQAAYRDALASCEQAFEAQSAVSGHESSKLIPLHLTLASLQLDVAGAEKGNARLALLREAEDNAVKAAWLIDLHGHRDSPHNARLEDLLGTLAMNAGDPVRARHHWKKSLEVARQTEQSVLIIRLLNRLAELETRERQFRMASELLDEAAHRAEALGAFPNLTYVTLVNRARVLLVLARLAKREKAPRNDPTETLEAQKLLERAAELVEEIRLQVGGNPLTQAQYFEHFGVAFTLLFNLKADAFARTGERTALLDALYYAESGRNRTFVDQVAKAGLQLENVLDRADQHLLVARTRLLQRKTQIASLLRAAAVAEPSASLQEPSLELTSTDTKSLLDAFKNVSQELEQTDQRIYQAIQDSSEGAASVVFKTDREAWPSQIEEILRPGVCLLFYHVGQHNSALVAMSRSRALHLPLSVRRDDIARSLSVETGPLTKAKIDKLVPQYLAILRSKATAEVLADAVEPTGDVSNTAQGKQAVVDFASALGTVLIPPAAQAFVLSQKFNTIVLVPDAVLHRLPFETLLLVSDSNPAFVLDRFPPIAYAPSAMTLARLIGRASGVPLGAASVLAVGEPSRPDLPQLSHAADEARKIAKLFADRQNGSRSDVILHENATEEAVRSALANGDYHIAHFALHAQVQQDGHGISGGLMLGKSESTSTAANDGQLTLAEVQMLPLRRCELVTLSACETNVGTEIPLEAGTTLARAFFAAGARRVVASQWEVSDRSTAALMISFFSRLIAQSERGSVDYAAALQQARIEVRRRSPSPYHWAPFVLIGPAW